MKTLRQLQTDTVKVARRKHGTEQFAASIVTNLRDEVDVLKSSPNDKTKLVRCFNTILRLADSQGVSGDDLLVMSEQQTSIDALKLSQKE